MAKTAFIIGCVASIGFAADFATIRLFIGGEEDWYFGIALVLVTLALLALAAGGIVVSLIALWQGSNPRWMPVTGLLLSACPWVWVGWDWLARQTGLW